MKLPVQFDPAIVKELSENLVAHHLHAYREGVANAYDADSPKIVIENSPQKISFEDWGEGIQDVSAFLWFGRPSKKEINETPIHKRRPIGEKGLGFLSYFKLGSQVTLSTNNGLIGYRIIRSSDEPLLADAEQGSANSFLNHKGLKVEITKVTRIIDDKELREYLKKYFPLIIARGFSITINGKELTPKKLSPTVSIETKLGKIVGDFIHHGGGVATVYCRGLFVCRTLIDASRDFQAWADCDFLVPKSGREDFVKDNVSWKIFDEAIKTYALRFPRTHSTVTPRFEQSMKKLLKALGNVAKELDVRIEGKIPTSPSTIEIPTIKGETGQEHKQSEEPQTQEPIQKRVPPYDKTHTFLLTEKFGKVLKTDYGMNLVYGHLEGELSPIIPQTPNTLIYNQSSEILTAIGLQEKRNQGRGVAHMLIPYLARAYIHLLPMGKTEDPEDLSDKIANGLYKKMTQSPSSPIPTEAKKESWD